MMTKVDFKKTLKPLYGPKPKKYEIIEIPKMNFLMIDGIGSPGTSEAYMDSLGALYPMAYKTKFLAKAMDKDYVVPPLEGLWWADDMNDFVADNKDNWRWTMMIMQPEWVTEDMIEQARDMARQKNPPKLLDNVRFESYDEGVVAQYLHIGSYADEAPVLQYMHKQYIPEQGYKMPDLTAKVNKHHEIYLSDPRRVAPEKLKTILRQPVELI
ncbi:MAG: GyrI-like domain-containing protein [OCS116 cluster bacterium]|uniref:GyrI-like small molecule binding domain-containing protein n=1 Tax=OCS116 cluster bacterium TaxID=2030921 RepID=A0A2A4Z2N8_9PROT|nr:GyrI-like domain-containing protein [OCS116 cluster bacterium]